MAGLEINCLIIDAADPERLAAFWSEVLGRPVVGRTGPYVWLRRENGIGVGIQRGEAPGPGKNRLHLDLACADPVAEQSRIEALGGRRLHAYDEAGFLVMSDPEGNEFCVIPEGEGAVGLDEQGRAHYLD
ncbi:VOC family protein [Streptomyces sp. NPDC046939]|uniref:VOC family protein n=1 Tax=Streptomyces sp. NPDC046939 TaxID=3155376 RepID=UPI003407B107